MDAKRKTEIVRYIISNAPSSCFADNFGDFKVEHHEFISDAEFVSFFYDEWMGFCGCGHKREELEVLHQVLKAIDGGNSYELADAMGTKETKRQTNGFVSLALKVLDKGKFTTHGTSVYAARLTEAGRMFLDVLDSYLAPPNEGGNHGEVGSVAD